MSTFLKPPQDSALPLELLAVAPHAYLTQRGLTLALAEANGIHVDQPALAPQRLRFMPKQFERARHALTLHCREFDGTYHPAADQVILFGSFLDPDTTELLERQRFSAKGIPNRIAWYGNTKDPQLVVYCESRIKALVVSQANSSWLCAGLNGVDGWSAGKDKEEVKIPAENLIPPIETGPLPAVLLPDSHHHKHVRRAMGALSDALRPHYRSVTLAKLPDPPDGREDWGADDVAAMYGPHVLNLFVKEDTSSSSGAFSLASASEIVLRRPPLWIVRDLIPTDELSLIVGETGCGKTFLTMDLLLAIARPECTQWLGHKIKAHGPTVHITLEGRSLPDRLRAYATHHKITIPSDYHAIEGNVTLHEDCERLIRAMERIHPVVIAVDTVNRALGGGDENSSTDMGAFVRAAERLRLAFPGCAVALVHHLGKQADRGARGHSSLKAAVGAELLVLKDELSHIRTLTLGKQRDGPTDVAISFQLLPVDLGQDDDNEPLRSMVVVPSVAPALTSDTSDREIYEWVWRWNVTENGGRPVSRETLRRNFGRIRPKGNRIKREDFNSAVEGAVNKGWCAEAKADRGGMVLTLQPPPERKF